MSVSSGAPPEATVPTASVSVKSHPDTADITVDGKHMGTTQSLLKLAPGDHTIAIEKAGFNKWHRVISVTANSLINVEATLEKAQ